MSKKAVTIRQIDGDRMWSEKLKGRKFEGSGNLKKRVELDGLKKYLR